MKRLASQTAYGLPIADCQLPMGGAMPGVNSQANRGRASVLARNWQRSQGSRGRSPSRASNLARFIVGPQGRARRFTKHTTKERK